METNVLAENSLWSINQTNERAIGVSSHTQKLINDIVSENGVSLWRTYLNASELLANSGHRTQAYTWQEVIEWKKMLSEIGENKDNLVSEYLKSMSISVEPLPSDILSQLSNKEYLTSLDYSENSRMYDAILKVQNYLQHQKAAKKYIERLERDLGYIIRAYYLQEAMVSFENYRRSERLYPKDGNPFFENALAFYQQYIEESGWGLSHEILEESGICFPLHKGDINKFQDLYTDLSVTMWQYVLNSRE